MIGANLRKLIMGNENSGRKESPFDLSDDELVEILELYKIGGSDYEVKALIWEKRRSFSNDLWDRWLIDEQVFSETVKQGRALSRGWWETQGRENIKAQVFNTQLWVVNMNNRFKEDWKQRHDITSGDKPIKQITGFEILPDETED